MAPGQLLRQRRNKPAQKNVVQKKPAPAKAKGLRLLKETPQASLVQKKPAPAKVENLAKAYLAELREVDITFQKGTTVIEKYRSKYPELSSYIREIVPSERRIEIRQRLEAEDINPHIFAIRVLEEEVRYEVKLSGDAEHKTVKAPECSRATGDEAGDYLVAGPDWKGDAPSGIKKVFRSSTQFSLAAYRTQLFNPEDMPNVIKVQAGYKAQPLSQYLNQPAPPAAPAVNFPKINAKMVKTGFFDYLDFALQFAPVGSEEKEIRAKLARLGIGAGKKFDFKDLSPEQQEQVGLAMKDGEAKIEQYLGSTPSFRPNSIAQADQAVH